jgi:hypothetical protein
VARRSAYLVARLAAGVALGLLAACGGDLDGVPAIDAPIVDAAPPIDAPFGCPFEAGRPGVCPGRGLYDHDVTVEIRAELADVFYTLDGSPPTTASTRYQGPITIAADRGAVILRAIATDGVTVTRAATHTYVFPARLADQPTLPEGFPARWAGSEGDLAGDYAMDPRVTTDAATFAALPVVSIAVDRGALFDPTTGIYVNAAREGVGWERPASLELLGEWQTDCGLRIQGGSSTIGWKSPKLSLRVAFRDEYGGDLRASPFAGGADRFDDLVLDAHLNLTWLHPDHGQRVRSQYTRDAYVADLQRLAGSLAPRSRFVHLFLDGLYWGLYELHERPDEHFAASYLGGDAGEYDVLKHLGSNVVAGDGVAWAEMMAIARGGLASDGAYAALAQYLDVDDFITYLLVNVWTGNEDWPHHNWYALRRRTPEGRFRFVSWDAEHVLKEPASNVTGVSAADGPGELWQALLANATFRARFSTRAAELLPLFESSRPVFEARDDEVLPAAAWESARWGDYRRAEDPYGIEEWLAERQRLREQWFPGRTAIVRGQLAARGL